MTKPFGFVKSHITDFIGEEAADNPEPADFEVGPDDGKPMVLGAVEARK
ncbi:MAG: hypothetical protein GY700_11215, partial [Propionibacteriaceae bacterium]|nr:hypothetical protein [Propionibacteriaceae bacterium]